jgi:hypothetical protein
VTRPSTKNEDRGRNERHRDDDNIDDKRDHAPRQHTLEQLGIGRGIIGVRPHVGGDADAIGSEVLSRTSSRRRT